MPQLRPVNTRESGLRVELCICGCSFSRSNLILIDSEPAWASTEGPTYAVLGVDWDARKERHTGALMRPQPFALLPCNLPSPRIRRAALAVSCTAELALCRRFLMQSNPFPNREVLRCPHCRLVQFRSTTGLCRRCHQHLETLHVDLPAGLSPSHGAALSTEPLSKRIGAAVRDLRKERRLSQRQLANAMGTVAIRIFRTFAQSRVICMHKKRLHKLKKEQRSWTQQSSFFVNSRHSLMGR